MKDQVWNDASGPDGVVRDPLTNEPMNPNEPWDMGHKPGYEFYKLQQYARENGLTRQEFLDLYYNPEHFQPELPMSNRGHAGELGTSEYFGP